MNNDKFAKKLLILTTLVILPISTSVYLGTIGVDLVAVLSPQQAFAQEGGISDSESEQIVEQAYATSSVDPLPGHEQHQSVTVLKLRDDNAVYSGRITFTATKPVEVQILHRNLDNAGPLNIPGEFGRFAVVDLPGGKGQVTITNVEPNFTEGGAGTTFAATVSFSGNAVALHNLQGDEFATTYTVTAETVGAAERTDAIQESQSTEPTASEQEESEQP